MEVLNETISRYRLVREIGSGGMGVVYAAFDPKLEREVAIKLLQAASDDPMYRKRFEREAQTIAALKHPNIATLFDFGETEDGRPFLVMELVGGRTLTEILLAGELTIASAVNVIVEVAEGLSAAHEKGLIHRDVKPSNIMVGEQGEVKILDFGLAKSFIDPPDQRPDGVGATSDGSKTQTGIVVGTPLYLSPEQAKGQSIDQRSDIFSLGSVLYEALTGRTAFTGQSSLEIGAQVIHVTPVVPSAVNPHLTPELDAITMKALEKEAQNRYQTAKELAQALREAKSALAGDRLPVPRQLKARSGGTTLTKLKELTQTFSRKRVPVGAIVIGLVLLLAGGFILQRMLRKAPYQPTPTARELVERGTVLLRNGELNRASALFRQATEADPKYPLAHARRAEVEFDLDAVNVATQELLKAQTLMRDGAPLNSEESLYFDALSASITYRKFDDAVKAYQQIVAQRPEDAKAYVDLGRALEKANQSGEAIKAYRQATEHDAKYATPYLRVGVLYTRRHEFGSASDAFNKADALFQQQPDIHEGPAQVAEKRGLMFRESGEYGEARKQFQIALDLAQTQKNPSLEVATLLDLSSVDILIGRPDEAKDKAQKALEMAQSNDLKPLVVTANIGLARTQFDRDHLSNAEEFLDRAASVAQAYDLQNGAQFVLINRAALRLQQTRPEEALQIAQSTKEFFAKEHVASSVVSSLVTIIRAQRQLGRFEDALLSGQERLKIATEADNRYEIGFSHGEIGSVLVALERYPEALIEYTEMYHQATAGDFKRNAAWAQVNRGEILWRLGRYPEAETAIADADKFANDRVAGDKSLAPEAVRIRAEMNLSQLKWAEAKALARPILVRPNPPVDELLVRSQLVSCLAQANGGSAAAGMTECQRAVDQALPMKNRALILHAQLSLAQALYLGGKMRAAADLAQTVAEDAARMKCHETAWRAWFQAAIANERSGDQGRAAAQRASSSAEFDQLQQQWGDPAIAEYGKRPDISNLK